MLSESTERLGVLRPLSLPPDGRAKTAEGRKGKGKESTSNRNTCSPRALSPAWWGPPPPPLCTGKGGWPPLTFPDRAPWLVNPTWVDPVQRPRGEGIVALKAKGLLVASSWGGWPGSGLAPHSPWGAQLARCSATADACIQQTAKSPKPKPPFLSILV